MNRAMLKELLWTFPDKADVITFQHVAVFAWHLTTHICRFSMKGKVLIGGDGKPS